MRRQPSHRSNRVGGRLAADLDPLARIAQAQMQRAADARQALHDAQGHPDTTRHSEALNDEVRIGPGPVASERRTSIGVRLRGQHIDLVTLMEAVVSAEEFGHVNCGLPAPSRVRAYEAVSAVVSDDHNFERGVGAARAVADRVLAEAGPAGLTEVAVELSLRLAEALERIATEQGVPAADLADVWFPTD